MRKLSLALTSSFLLAVSLMVLPGCPGGTGGDGDGDGDGDDDDDDNGDGDGDGDGDGGATRDQLIEAYIDYWLECVFPPDGRLIELTEGADQVPVVRANYEAFLRRLFEVSIFSEDVGINQAAAQGCIAALNASTCTDVITECSDVFTSGTRELGEVCTSSSQCASSVCEYSWDVGCGECVADTPAPAGETCYQRECVATAYCNYDYDDVTETSTEICMAFVGEGGACVVEDANGNTNYFECAEGLECNYSLGTCRGPVAAGAICRVPVPGETYDTSLECVDGYYCDYGTELCEARVGLGQSCAYDVGTGSSPECDEDLYCDQSDLCATLPGAGGSCATSYACAEGAYCDYDTYECIAYPGLGGDCSDTYECTGELACDWDEYICVVDHPEGTEAGDPCYENGAGCEYPLECVGDLGNQTCQSPPEVVIVGEGESCDETRSCGNVYATALYCHPSSGVCTTVDVAAEDEDCDDTATYCAGMFTSHYCDSDLGVCRPIVEVGGACDDYGACGNLSGASCVFVDGAATGTCRTQAYAGESCADANTTCGYGLECTEGVCTTPDVCQ